MSSNTQNIVVVGGPGLLAQIVPVTTGFMTGHSTGPISITPTKGWPVRHSRRVGWYRFHILKMVQILEGPSISNKMNPSAKPWSEHELEVFQEVREKLAGLYNNRYEEYYKMRMLEKGLEYFPRNKEPNKFILKC